VISERWDTFFYLSHLFFFSNVEAAIELYLNSGGDLSSLCPPDPSPQTSTSTGHVEDEWTPQHGVRLSCGHIEANLDPKTLSNALDMIKMAKAGHLSPQHLDGEYGEFSNGFFSIMISLKQLKK